MEILKSQRDEIDRIDEKIIALLVERFGIVDAVAKLKAENNIPVVQSARADEVKNRVASMAEAGGLDGTLLRNIYTLIIDHAHVVEDKIIKDRKG